ncbi:TPA: hypothetical protein IYE61_002676 [Enterococcus faecium]|nr:hypothetical protein [Enterococcus faecium]
MTPGDPGHQEWNARRQVARELYGQAVAAIATLPLNAREGANRILTQACSYPSKGRSIVATEVAREEQRGMSFLTAALPLWIHDPVAFGNAAHYSQPSPASE